ncbi:MULTISPECIES: SDR family NAD(P)-dependent oxidoreductase [unclassified Novosphingobium]|uniref:SDR family NAD(P)-dependent oxidoreductase n=1 Tax=unclassified Novosphingobium TaxID=2644732 RepID=UPI000D322219|nr:MULTISPECIES: SDR family NAD(P)-dependent oxidoreductase [unclassified Novosphingobium]PTR12583.1 NAD(P)-dependent dehydrogenase (short-subunit alcohol dehydrogenase family) [Novosphingobium sp. GV055]PUB06367.1 NAD(P)-dependent dehydrogenase (short-subunit alcohol dehydrogenase family) [Novosphingobium sp. GV061]PUB22418.1 NAD(P)-dependent dehydrogenase (short-subunit alcohol dehydrogenase family) [Novosphingobium sp. GV079]PUB44443.1 NAD(P)-dependent dehydrogenase (short-subunit alcohol de
MSQSVTRFLGKTVLVTGGASLNGIGYAAARRLAAEGAKVVITDIDGVEAEQRATELRVEGSEALGLMQDVTSEQQWADVVAQVVARFGGLDGLVNNAGISLLHGIEEVGLDEWNKQISINLTGTFLGCRAAIAHMRAQGRGGAIVNVSSVAGLVGMRRTSAYSATKGGVRLMTKTLALEAGLDGIRVNSVHPGVTETDIQINVRKSDPAQSAAIAASIPLGRVAAPAELGAAIAFLLSEDASYITGSELAVDGGLTAQ